MRNLDKFGPLCFAKGSHPYWCPRLSESGRCYSSRDAPLHLMCYA